MVSIIIPTYNGKHKITGILNVLAKQSYTEMEVIVVIDGSTDGTADAIRRQEITLPNFKIVEQENQGRSVVRNRGAEEAEGDLLLFFDDDMLPLPNCVEGHVAHHAKHPGTILTGGLGEEITKDSPEIMKFKSYLSNKWTSDLKRNADGRLAEGSTFITAANFSISKALFKKLGGFDEQLKDAEDFDFGIRAVKAGVPLYFDPSVFAWHNDTITAVSYIKRQREYRRAHQVLNAQKPWLRNEGYNTGLDLPKGAKKVVFELFASHKWIQAIDKEGLSLLPKNIRYKVYDLIITANGTYFPDKVSLP